MHKIKCYTDGGTNPNPGKGGWGVILICDKLNYRKEMCGGFEMSTNNRMELIAAIKALEAIKPESTESVELFSDSAYVVNENEYNLLMKVDTNTKGSSFWFNFKVRGIWKSTSKQRNGHANTERGRVIKFNIVNFNKSDIKGFYQNGMNVMSRVCRDEDEINGSGGSASGMVGI
jgi:ribonuclease HI